VRSGLLAVLLTTLAGCGVPTSSDVIDLDDRVLLPAVAPSPSEPTLNVAVGAMITPKEGFAYYQRLLRYLGSKLDMQVNYVDRSSYAETNRLLQSAEIDIAFLCSGPYVDGKKTFGLELLAVPMAYGQTVYQSYVMVRADGDLRSFDDLRGKRFGFTDPDSNTGRIVPTHWLAQRGTTPEEFFSEVVYTWAHDASIEAVATGIVDGVAVDSLIWEYTRSSRPELADKTRVVWRSPAYGIPPVVSRPGLDPQLRDRIQGVLLGMVDDPAGREILNGMRIDRFQEGDDAAYDSIRAMKAATLTTGEPE
jgi:phosphonate transport system substrate-binding protein